MEYKKFIVLYGVYNTSDIANQRSKFGWIVDQISHQYVMMKRDSALISNEILTKEIAYELALSKYIEHEKKARVDKENMWIYLILIFPYFIYLGYIYRHRMMMKEALNEIESILNSI